MGVVTLSQSASELKRRARRVSSDLPSTPRLLSTQSVLAVRGTALGLRPGRATHETRHDAHTRARAGDIRRTKPGPTQPIAEGRMGAAAHSVRQRSASSCGASDVIGWAHWGAGRGGGGAHTYRVFTCARGWWVTVGAWVEETALPCIASCAATGEHPGTAGALPQRAFASSAWSESLKSGVVCVPRDSSTDEHETNRE